MSLQYRSTTAMSERSDTNGAAGHASTDHTRSSTDASSDAGAGASQGSVAEAQGAGEEMDEQKEELIVSPLSQSLSCVCPYLL